MINILSKQLPFIKGFVISVTFSILLLFTRIIKTDSGFFLFLVWNLFLACIPYAITMILSFRKINNLLFWTGFIIWLAFLPNSPYILTDLQHIRLSTLQSVWFDVLLILSFAINGLIIGFVSLKMMQKLLVQRFSKTVTDLITYLILLLCGFGIYLGRILRWNSWDILQHPLDILADIAKRILFPIQHLNTWAFTIGFGGFLIITYRLFIILKKIEIKS
ncbi:DUF1361 domain-containing protein [Aquimarina sp. 2201CG5-10]|uniref:DUF1361 domain-containing protein n=1 Tax=Aquimarina callyspongiae TaxID=3098150 RepID=UPI002AB36D84|nr:DUF1361 domain-containing protein [Aquimarina sp. 2201CG5-10]MDY8138572.1 DUF1361 domain-containing protein [Aquimarina sp. 2201CG5-10]